MKNMKQKMKTSLVVAFVILVLDHITKAIVVRYMSIGDVIPVAEGFFDWVHVRNRGAAFGFLAGWDSGLRDVFFYILSGVAVFFLVSFLKQLPPQKMKSSIPVGLILGGAVGNLLDRIFRGSVVDFVSVYWGKDVHVLELLGRQMVFSLQWPAFNVADSAITVGVFWLVTVLLMLPKSDLKD